MIAITALCAPTSFVITADSPLQLDGVVERDANGRVTKLNLPDHLVVMANHQAYTDWMYVWILACYAGAAEGITILLKASLKHVPFVGWGMVRPACSLCSFQQFFRFIFLKRSWAADRLNLTHSLKRLVRATFEQGKRHPLWLVIFPEGTITSDNERAKSLRYAQREGIVSSGLNRTYSRQDDFEAVLLPRSTGLLFCLRTLLPEVPDLKLLDVTIGYPGVPFGKYPQEWYSLTSVFFRSVPPPTVRIHLHLYSDLGKPGGVVPSLGNVRSGSQASEEEVKSFESWLRETWAQKEALLKTWSYEPPVPAGSAGYELVPVKQVCVQSSPQDEEGLLTSRRWADWVFAFGGGGVFTLGATMSFLRRCVSL